EGALLHIGKHLRVGTEPAFREDLEPECAAGIAADRLGHLGEAPCRRAVRGLIEAETVMKAGIGHSRIIIGSAGRTMPLTPALSSRAGRGRAHERRSKLLGVFGKRSRLRSLSPFYGERDRVRGKGTRIGAAVSGAARRSA